MALDPHRITVGDIASLPAVLSVKETAALLRLSTNAVYDGIARGDIEAMRVGRALRIPTARIVDRLRLGEQKGGEATTLRAVQ